MRCTKVTLLIMATGILISWYVSGDFAYTRCLWCWTVYFVIVSLLVDRARRKLANSLNTSDNLPRNGAPNRRPGNRVPPPSRPPITNSGKTNAPKPTPQPRPIPVPPNRHSNTGVRKTGITHQAATKPTTPPQQPVAKQTNLDKSSAAYPQDNDIEFFADKHVYLYKGAIQLTPVGKIIDLFFKPFDSEKWSQIKASQNGISQQAQLEIWDNKGEKSRQVGTFLHLQIQRYLTQHAAPELLYNYTYNGKELRVAETIDISTEWGFFLDFLAKENVIPFRCEWHVCDPALRIAGTIDLLCRNGNSFDLYDWKRSDKISKYDTAWNYGINGLGSVPDTKYYHYCLQQNLYKYILEKNYGVKIGKMYLVVLHPTEYSYRKIPVPEMAKEVNIIIDYMTTKHKRSR